jgi:hypothetical protein
MGCEIVKHSLTRSEEKLETNVLFMTSFSLLVHTVALMC